MKALFVVAPAEVRDEEYFIPKKVLENAGIKVDTTCRTREAETAVEKKKITADLLLGEARAKDYDAIVFIGGMGADVYFDDAQAHALAQQAEKEGRVLAAICIAPVILANAGVLKGRKVTASSGTKETLEEKGAHYTGASVERDGKIVTASGPNASEEFGKELLRAINSRA